MLYKLSSGPWRYVPVCALSHECVCVGARALLGHKVNRCHDLCDMGQRVFYQQSTLAAWFLLLAGGHLRVFSLISWLAAERKSSGDRRLHLWPVCRVMGQLEWGSELDGVNEMEWFHILIAATTMIRIFNIFIFLNVLKMLEKIHNNTMISFNLILSLTTFFNTN